jgi:hAT family C-terminal dimerisation region
MLLTSCHTGNSKRGVGPKLTRVAKCLLGVPAASTSSERAFSLAGFKLDDRRTQLSTNTLDSLMFIHRLKKMTVYTVLTVT